MERELNLRLTEEPSLDEGNFFAASAVDNDGNKYEVIFEYALEYQQALNLKKLMESDSEEREIAARSHDENYEPLKLSDESLAKLEILNDKS
ncbi:MAG: hypothetical protein FWG45_06770, partial [Oscillospiraceae bacterium]|nr:hypothetical protein [Oscillospiraceae bacterium]